jgi:hypothetical protein
MWNLNFALLPLISQWEFTRNLTAAAEVLPLFAGATDWWACYLVKVRMGRPRGFTDTELQ